MVETGLVQILEAAMLAAGKPLSVQNMADLFEEQERPENTEIRGALKEIAERCPIDLTTVTRTLGRMERDGLVRRRRNKQDRRVVNFFLTASAKANRDAAITGTVEVNELAFRGFDDAEREAVMNLMERLEDNLRGESSAHGV